MKEKLNASSFPLSEFVDLCRSRLRLRLGGAFEIGAGVAWRDKDFKLHRCKVCLLTRSASEIQGLRLPPFEFSAEHYATRIGTFG